MTVAHFEESYDPTWEYIIIGPHDTRYTDLERACDEADYRADQNGQEFHVIRLDTAWITEDTPLRQMRRWAIRELVQPEFDGEQVQFLKIQGDRISERVVSWWFGDGVSRQWWSSVDELVRTVDLEKAVVRSERVELRSSRGFRIQYFVDCT